MQPSGRQIKLNRFQEKAEYDETSRQQEKPRYAYEYDYEHKPVDKSDPDWKIKWLRQTKKDLVGYLLDLTLRRDINAVMFKTAGFSKRQFGRFMSVMDYLGGLTYHGWVEAKHGLKHMVHGLKALMSDGKWVVNQQVESRGSLYDQYDL